MFQLVTLGLIFTKNILEYIQFHFNINFQCLKNVKLSLIMQCCSILKELGDLFQTS